MPVPGKKHGQRVGVSWPHRTHRSATGASRRWGSICKLARTAGSGSLHRLVGRVAHHLCKFQESPRLVRLKVDMDSARVPPDSGKNPRVLMVNRNAHICLSKMELHPEDVRGRKLACNAVGHGLIPIRETGEELLNDVLHLGSRHQISAPIGSQAKQRDRVFGFLLSAATHQ